jgi:MFS family permease
MFLMFAVIGAWVPLFSVRLDQLGFTPLEIALASATGAMAYLTAPVAAGQVADRWFAAERCLAVGGLVGGGLLWLLAELHDPTAVFWTCLAFWSIMVPVITIGNALTFSHLDDPTRRFGTIRLWGTVGWVAAGWLVGLWWWLGKEPWREALGLAPPTGANIFHLGAILAWVLALYALTLPHTPPQRHGQGWLAPLQALRLLRHRDFTVYLVGSFGLYLTIPINSQVTPLLLKSVGIGREELAPLLTISQSMEVLLLLLLPHLMDRLGVRATMLLGLATWTAGLSVFALGQPTWLVVAALACNGVCVACFMVAGQVFLNTRAGGTIRASTQSLLVFVNGIGLLLGNLLVGVVRQQTEPAFAPTYWTAVTLDLALIAFFITGFPRRPGSGATAATTVTPAALSCAEPAENLK